jgi:hypothetical protein
MAGASPALVGIDIHLFSQRVSSHRQPDRFAASRDVRQSCAAAPLTTPTARQSFEEQCQQVSRRRRKIQIAIDSEYPVSAENAAFRRRFGLQPDRAMS